ncbi:MAG: ATP phosphoribosyltransferase [Anaerolineae bacterium]|jgi:ATP phosphoribosyltransferase|nr:ATP phosphoribosyltransferase [Chloroflexota bacterium]
MDPITVALPKGRMQDDVLGLFCAAGYPTEAESSRSLVFADKTGTLRFLLAKPSDVPTYVEYGAAALGIAGLDTVREGGHDLYEPLSLGIGRCHLALAGPASWRERDLRREPFLRVASKYPHLAQEYFERRDLSAEIIYLTGSIELAPAVGLADLLVDLVESGRTLRENGLVELETIMESEATLIANPAAHKLRSAEIREIIGRLADVVALRKVAP